MEKNTPAGRPVKKDESGEKRTGPNREGSDRQAGAASAFMKDKRRRITHVEKAERTRTEERGESSERPERARTEESGGYGKSETRAKETFVEKRSSFNPNFTRDNRPREDRDERSGKSPWRREGRENGAGGEERGAGSRFSAGDARGAGSRFSAGGERRSSEGRKPYGKENYGERKPYDKDASRPGDRFGRESGDRNVGGPDDRFPREGRDAGPGFRKEGEYKKSNYDRNKPGKSYDKPGGGFDRPGKNFDKPGAGKEFNRPDRGFDKPGKSYGGPGKSFDKSGKNFDRPAGPGGYGGQGGYGGKKEGRYQAKSGQKRDQQYSRDNYPRFTLPASEEPIRLNRYLAMSGLSSRREADDLITSGSVTVNGVVVTELGVKIGPDDVVCYNNNVVHNEKKVYLVMNKPKGYVTTVEDPNAVKTVMDLLGDACKERVYPVGRLDKNSMGVLLFTNDGDMTKRLTHPSYNKKKIYQVTLDKPVAKSDLTSLVEGFTLEDGEIHADSAEYVNENRKEVGLEIHSGRNRIVRRMFEHLGYKVLKLDRAYFAGLTKKNLKRGKWRFLTPQEVQMLHSGKYE